MKGLCATSQKCWILQSKESRECLKKVVQLLIGVTFSKYLVASLALKGLVEKWTLCGVMSQIFFPKWQKMVLKGTWVKNVIQSLLKNDLQ